MLVMVCLQARKKARPRPLQLAGAAGSGMRVRADAGSAGRVGCGGQGGAGARRDRGPGQWDDWRGLLLGGRRREFPSSPHLMANLAGMIEALPFVI